MNFKLVARYLGGLLLFFTLSTIFPFSWSFGFGEQEMIRAFYITWLVGVGVGGTLILIGRKASDDFFLKEAIVVVSFGWFLCAFLAALPFYVSGFIPHFIDAYFESMSGLTTTGATILTEIETLPKGFLFWRSFIQWLGGMGIIVLFVAVLPALGVGGKFLYRLEVPGISKEGLKPQIREAASILWKIYIFLSIFEVLALKLCGMTFFDALCHTFTTMATGGFSNYNDSIGSFDSFLIEAVITFFMFLAGINFTLHYFFLQGQRKTFWENPELRSYIGILVLAILFISGFLYFQSSSAWSLAQAFRHSIFNAVSIMTTTGYSTVNFGIWPGSAQLILIGLMFIGGCTGSTGGGMKVFRIMVSVKSIYLGVIQFFRPRVIRRVRFGNETITDEVQVGISRFFLLFVSIFFVCSLGMTFLGLDLVTATSSVIACMGNIGPGLAKVGPTHNFAFIPDSGKCLLTLCMVLGRLELYTALAIFIPGFWRNT